LKRKSEQASIETCENAPSTKKSRIIPDIPYINLVRLPPDSVGFLYLTGPKSPPYFIQRLIENKKIPYSGQWELARLVSKDILSWNTITGGRAIKFEEIDLLRPSGYSGNPHSECVRKVHDVFLSGDNGGKVIALGSNSLNLLILSSISLRCFIH